MPENGLINPDPDVRGYDSFLFIGYACAGWLVQRLLDVTTDTLMHLKARGTCSYVRQLS